MPYKVVKIITNRHKPWLERHFIEADELTQATATFMADSLNKKRPDRFTSFEVRLDVHY